MEKTPLSLNPDPDSEDGAGSPEDEIPQGENAESPGLKTAPVPENPVIGWFAIGFGFLAIFVNGPIFVPLTLICSVVALFMRQISWAFIGLLLAVVGFLTSPVLLTLLGLGWIISYF